MKKLKSQSKKRISKLILTLCITLISIPAISMMAGGPHIGILDCCNNCGVCAANYPNSFVMNPITEKAELLTSYTIEDVEAAQAECPQEAIMTSW
mgnify:CR=1 FL=1|jgi:ferredoxin